MSNDEVLRRELLRMARDDDRLRSELMATGALSDEGYHPRMAAVHSRNADRLGAIIAEQGWPGRSRVGGDGARAAWLVLQHAIGRPELQRAALPLLEAAAAAGEADPLHAAYLEDRIAFFEERPQRFGTQFDWDRDGRLSPWAVENREDVDERRAALGLEPLEHQTRHIRERAEAEGERPPVDWEAYRRRKLAWARRVGWLR